ncbi:MAG: NADH-quinone oxidoreductase subunit N, partial [Chloroflexi bacterium]|nr:NADH-quinone oxidoreductase subunit N [Chloroflexota bacterium]
MSSLDLVILQPYLLIAATAVAQMLLIAFRRSHRATFALGLAGMAAALVALAVVQAALPADSTVLLRLDAYASLFTVLIVLASMAVMVLSYYDRGRHRTPPEEYYVLLSMAVLGGAVLVAANHFAAFFLGLELLSVSLYGLIAYPRARDRRALEAAMKYLVLAGAASGCILFGGALVYAETGALELPRLTQALIEVSPSILSLAGLALIVAGLGFKLGLVPFHFWTPDVYEGAPAPVAGFLATASKGAVLALLMRHLAPTSVYASPALLTGLAVLAAASMVGGSLLALLQDNVKRMLGGSSIAHMGYALLAFLAGGERGATALAFYLVAYIATMLGAFGLISLLSDESRRAERLEDFRGLARSRPWAAAVMTTMLLSLAGMPLTAGFVGKLAVAAVGAWAALWPLLGVLAVSSVLGLVYYLRVVLAMCRGLEEDAGGEAPPALSP